MTAKLSRHVAISLGLTTAVAGAVCLCPLTATAQDRNTFQAAAIKAFGVVAFNINVHAEVQADIATLREAFPQLYLFRISSNEEVVAIATRGSTRASVSGLRRTARAADRQYRKNFSFQAMLKSLVTK